MSVVAEMSQALLTALAAIPDVRAYQDAGSAVDPPGAVLGPPRLAWEGYTTEPTSATYLVYVVVAASDRALQQLWDLVPQVAAAIDTVPDAAVTTASPGSFASGGADLPAYLITVETSL